MRVFKKFIGCVLVAAITTTALCAGVFAAGSAPATPKFDGSVTVTEAGQTQSVGTGDVKSVTVAALGKGTDSTSANVEVNLTELIAQIAKVLSGQSKSEKLVEPKQSGSSKFKGYKVTLKNGKTKYVKKLTAKLLSQIATDDKGNIKLTAAFKVDRFNVKVQKVVVNGVKVAVPGAVAASVKKASYDTPVDLSKYTEAYKNCGYKVIGYATKKGSTTPEYQPNQKIYLLQSGKSIKLFPILEKIDGTDAKTSSSSSAAKK